MKRSSCLPRLFLAASLAFSLVVPPAGAVPSDDGSGAPPRLSANAVRRVLPGTRPGSEKGAKVAGATVRLVAKATRRAGIAGLRDKARAMGLTTTRTIPRLGWAVVEVPAADAESVGARLKADGVASAVERDVRVTPAFVPNDPLFAGQWALRNTGSGGSLPDADIDADEAWDTATGSSDVVVAVCDTGAQLTHPDLAANAWVNPGEIAGNGVDDDLNGYIDDVNGWDWVHGDATVYDATDLDGGVPADTHGTHVSGIIGAAGNNGVGIAGVNHRVSIMSLKTIGAGGGYLTDSAAAIVYATDNGADVINHSWTADGTLTVLEDAFRYSADHGVLNVAAAGNFGTLNDDVPYFPASSPATNVVSVAASDNQDNLVWWSNRGQTVDLAAPGVTINSTVPEATYPSGFDTMSGTSMATPHVTGSIALIKSVFPNATAEELRARIEETVDRPVGLDRQVRAGGRLNLAAALAPQIAAAPSALAATGGTTLEAGSSAEFGWTPSPVSAAASTYQAQLGVNSQVLADGFEGSVAGWTTGGDMPFTFSTVPSHAHSGVRGARSGVITDTQYSTLSREVSVPSGGGLVSFWYWLDSEDGWDIAYLVVDGTDYRWGMDHDMTWSRTSVPLPGGKHTLTWVYEKDASVSEGRDAFGIDDVTVSGWAWEPVQTVGAGSTSATLSVPRQTGHTARVRVRAALGAQLSNWTEIAGLTIAADSTPPAAPTGLAAESGDRQAALTWNASSETDFDHYELWRAAGAGEFSLVDGALTSPSAADTGLTNGTEYWYQVRAVDSTGNASDPSSAESVTPADIWPPAVPTGLTLVPGDRAFALSWDAAPEPDVVGWEVWRAEDGGEPVKLADVTAPATTFDDVGPLVPGTSYEYRLVAVDDDGNRSDPAVSSGIAEDTTPPATPIGLAATAGPGSVSLTWDANDPDAAEWAVFRAVAGATFSQVATASTNTWIDDTVSNRVRYQYRLKAVDAAGNVGNESATVSATPLGTVTRLAGTSRYATALDVSRKSFTKASTVVLATGVSYADALSASALAGVYRAPLLLTGGDKLPDGTFAELQRLGAKTVVIVGGTAAVSAKTEALLKGRGFAVARLAGADRYATAEAVAKKVKELGGGARVFVARGDDFPDALSASPLAYAMRYPVLLVRPGGIPSPTASALTALKPAEAIVLGSTRAISAGVASGLRVPTDRWPGEDRYATSAVIAARAVQRGWASFAAAGIATGAAFPDALSGGPAIGARGGVMLLTRTGELPSAMQTLIRANVGDLDRAYVIGGTVAVSTWVEANVESLMGVSPARVPQ